MRTLLFASSFLFAALSGMAQCGSTWTARSWIYCGSPAGSLVWRTSGTSPAPYSMTLYYGNGTTPVASVTNNTTGSWVPVAGGIYQPFRVVITDANNCTQTVYSDFIAGAVINTVPTATAVAVDPETGVGGVDLAPGVGMYDPTQPGVDANCMFYQLNRNASPYRSGGLSGDGTPGAGGGWTYAPSQLSYRGCTPGSYAMSFTNNGCGGSGWDYNEIRYPFFVSGPWTCYMEVTHCNQNVWFTVAAPVSDPNPVRLPMKVLLEGPYVQSTDLMGDQLRSTGRLPWSFPSTSLGYTLTRPNTANWYMDALARAVSGANAFVDWVVVELRDAGNPANVVYSRAALLQRDGDVVMQNGLGPLSCNIAAGNYYVAVKHRNHLGVMTATPVALGLSTALIDFTNPATATYGTSALKPAGARMVMRAGDTTGNGTLMYVGTGNDRDPILTAVGNTTPNNSLTGQYSRLDTNLDGVIKYTGTANDRDIILTNVGSTTPNNTRTQQLP